MIDLSKNVYLQKRSAGVSLPLSAMKGTEDWGCGDMASLKEWIEYFASYDIKVLQILPLWETSPREHCPYSALSAYAIDPIYISIKDVPEVQNSKNAQEILADLQPEIDNWRKNANVQFDSIKPAKYRVLWAAYEYFEKYSIHSFKEDISPQPQSSVPFIAESGKDTPAILFCKYGFLLKSIIFSP